jgi:gas vesicle protein
MLQFLLGMAAGGVVCAVVAVIVVARERGKEDDEARAFRQQTRERTSKLWEAIHELTRLIAQGESGYALLCGRVNNLREYVDGYFDAHETAFHKPAQAKPKDKKR